VQMRPRDIASQPAGVGQQVHITAAQPAQLAAAQPFSGGSGPVA
jgi:hypothetical protein